MTNGEGWHKEGLKEHMAEQSVDQLEATDESRSLEAAELPKEPSDYEKRLRRDLARYREQIRIVQSERDANVAAATRDRDDTIAMVRSEATGRVIRAELKAHALKAGIIDLDGLRLADTSKLTLSDEGDVVGAESLIDMLRQEKPYLFSDARAGVSTGTTGQTQRPPSPATPSAVDARTLTREAWQAERARLLDTNQ